MKHWPHSPLHLFDFKGAYMVTGSTIQKEHFFKTPDDLSLLEKHLFILAEKYGWRLEAWALFPNHYHIIAHSPENPGSLQKFIAHFHSNTARELNLKHSIPGRKVWFQYWDTQLTYPNSYYARLNYVMQNPVKHGVVLLAENYPWCSAHWFTKNAKVSHQSVVFGYKIDAVSVNDDF